CARRNDYGNYHNFDYW
nr:immunoglobulin heavy chain junction region [Macaca mulatta]MOV90669.1 immunoglobulin heavy chain junction region [Macaca mulatta]